MVKTTIKIDGMMCGMCEAHVCDIIRRNFNIKKVSASHVKNQAVVISNEAIDEEFIKKVIGDTGYKVLDVDSEPYEKKGFLGIFKGKN